MKIILWLFGVLIINHGIGQTIKPVNLNDGIQIATLSEVGMKASVVNELTNQITSGYYPNIHSLLIYKDDKLAYENYFKGKDQYRGKDLGIIEHNINDLHGIRSISKSVVSACIGIAIAQGKIRNTDQKIFNFFKEYAVYDTGMIKGLSIKHLLTMTSGLKWNEEVPYDNPENSEIQMSRSADPIGFILSCSMTALPGKEWQYNGGTTQLLSMIIERTTGKKVDEFAKEYLFSPLGITTFEWIKMSGTNNPAGASGLRLRSRDLLKFGILYHNKGKWNGKQIIPRDWIEQSFHTTVNRPVSTTHPKPTGGYGYQFWTFNDTIQTHPVNIVAAVGNGDQRIYFDEKNNLLVVVTAGNYNIWTIQNNSYAILKRIYDSFHVKQD
ncbi:MAG TPA: serine hydrolase [Flavitalea sp.]|nr:serine hydrolase [Flavitalea sp.]HTF29792.1 serine hydrolase [Flavitalea sp.]